MFGTKGDERKWSLWEIPYDINLNFSLNLQLASNLIMGCQTHLERIYIAGIYLIFILFSMNVDLLALGWMK